MPIDPNIPLQAKNPQIETGINQLASMGEAMKIGEMQRNIGVQNQLRNLYSQGIDVGTPEGFKQVAALDPATALKLRADALQGRKLQSEVNTSEYKLKRDKTNDAILTIANFESPQAALGDINRRVEAGELPLEIGQQHARQIQSMPWAQYKSNAIRGLLSAYEQTTTDTTRRGQDITANTAIRGQDISAQTTRRGQDLVDLRTREGQAMQYNPDLQAKIAEAKASGEFIGKNKATAAAALPGALEAAKEGIRLIDEMVGQAEVKDKSGKVITKGTAAHPGFKGYVGSGFSVGSGGITVPGQRFAEGSDVASFEVRQKQIEGKAFLEAFQTLKGGGAITEKEGEKGTAAIMRMNKASSEKEYVAAARELQGILRTGMDRARTKAGTPAPSDGGGEIDFNSLK